MEENRLISGRVMPTLVRFALPFLAANILQTLYGTVDVFVIGKFGSTAGVSAVSCGAQLMSTLTMLLLGFTNAASVLIGQYIGAEQRKNVARVVGTGVWCFLGVAVLFGALMLGLHPMFLRLINIPPEAMAEARQYVFICACGIPLIAGYNAVCAILRGLGDSRSPLLFVGVACVVNIIGDVVLTGLCGLGARGVAIATVTAQGVSFAFALLFLMRRGLGIPFSRADLRPDGTMLGRIVKIGFPLAIQSSLVNLSFLLITAIINKMGVTASAAMGIGDKLIGFAFLPNTSFAAAIQVMVAQNMGAGKPDRALRCTFSGIAIAASWGTLFCLVSQIWPTLLPSIFTGDQTVQALTGLYNRAYSIDAILTAFMFCLDGLFAGCGHTTFTMAQNLISTFGVRVPMTWAVSRFIANANLFQLGLAGPVTTLVSVLIYAVYLKTGRWKKLAVKST